ncbi:hypothetical protein PG990_009083 [Apiospora arundinis]
MFASQVRASTECHLVGELCRENGRNEDPISLHNIWTGVTTVLGRHDAHWSVRAAGNGGHTHLDG